MTGIVFLILCVLSSMLFPCQGQVKPPTNGTTLTFFPGTTGKIDWSYTVDVSDVQLRTWRFNSSDGSRTGPLTEIFNNNDPESKDLRLIPRFKIDKPATLILMNVDQTYNGMYTFSLQRRSAVLPDISKVTVYIAVKPTVTVCATTTTVNESQNVECPCTSKGGNPPANLTWTKDGKKINETKVRKNILFLRNVSASDAGNYMCTAESYPDEKYRDAKSVEVKVNFGPRNTKIEPSQKVRATLGRPLTITCRSDGYPEPSYNITHNGTVVSTENKYDIDNVRYLDAGKYICIATNKFGDDSDILIVSVEQEPAPTSPKSKPTSSTEGTGVSPGDDESKGLGAGAIAGIVIGVLVLVVIIVVLVYYCKTKQRSGYKGNTNVKPGDNGSEDAAENTYDTASGPSGSRTKSSKGDAPVVYSAVDKENRQGRPLYATLDEAAMRAPNNRKTPEEERPEPTQYASIEFGKTEEVPKADLV